MVKQNLIEKKNAPSRAQRVLKKNDILFQAVRPYQKNNYIVTEDGNLVASTGYIQLRNDKQNQTFIYYFLQNNSFIHKVLQRCIGTTYPAISAKDFSTLKCFISINDFENKKIGDILLLFDNLITLYERNYQLYMLLFKEFQKNFFFNKVNNFYPLSSLVKIKTGTRNSQDNVSDGKYIFFDRSTEVKKLNEFDFDEKAIIIPGEGTKFIPHYINEKYALHQRTYSLYDFSEKISPKYLYYFLMTQSNNFLKYSVGTTVPSLRITTFNHIKVPVYSKKVQEKYVFVLDSLNNFLIQIKNKENILKELKNFLLQTMFI